MKKEINEEIIPDIQLIVIATCLTSDLTHRQADENWMSIIGLLFERILPFVN